MRKKSSCRGVNKTVRKKSMRRASMRKRLGGNDNPIDLFKELDRQGKFQELKKKNNQRLRFKGCDQLEVCHDFVATVKVYLRVGFLGFNGDYVELTNIVNKYTDTWYIDKLKKNTNSNILKKNTNSVYIYDPNNKTEKHIQNLFLDYTHAFEIEENSQIT